MSDTAECDCLTCLCADWRARALAAEQETRDLLGRLFCSTVGGRSDCARAGAHVEDCMLHGLTPEQLKHVGP